MTTQFCLFCNSIIEPKPKSRTGRNKIYCSPNCCFKYWKQNHKEHYKELVTQKNIFYVKQKVERWKALNLCSRCGNPRAQNSLFTRCEKCREYQRNYYLFAQNKKIKGSEKETEQIRGNVTTN
jgi:hypothetical protein